MEAWERDIRTFCGEAGGTNVQLIHPETGKTIRGGVLWPYKQGGHRGYIDIAIHLLSGFPKATFSLYTKHSVKWCSQAKGYVRYGGLVLSDKDYNMVVSGLLNAAKHWAYPHYEDGWESERIPQEYETCPVAGCTCADV